MSELSIEDFRDTDLYVFRESKYFVFIQGYNVPQEAARGWHAETFKRLHQLGSNARFVGVTWHGDTGLDYHEAVKYAFITGHSCASG